MSERKRLNIMFVTGSLYNQFSGPFQTLLGTVTLLHSKGHNTITVGSKDTWTQGFPFRWHPFPAVAFCKIGPYSLHLTPGLGLWIASFKKPVDIVSFQSVWQLNNYIVARWCEKRSIPYLVSVHGNLNREALSVSKLKKKLARRLFVDHVLENAKCIHALNKSEYEAVRCFGASQPVCIIPNCVDLPGDNQRSLYAKGTIIKHKLENKKICLYLGRLHPIKGLANLVRAWAKIRRQANEWVLILAGPDDSGYKARLDKLINQLDLRKSIIYVGPQYEGDKAAWFCAASFYVLPSQSEGFAVTALEAMSFKLPVLLTTACNFSEIVTHAAGIVTDTSVTGLADGLNTLITMPNAKRRELGENGYRLAKLRYQWDVSVDRLVEVYLWMLGIADPPPTIIFE